MFLFFSKLLPLFVYPLGLACLLLVVALLTINWKPRWAATSIGLALVILLLSGNGWVSQQLTRSLEWQHLPPADLPQADAIVVLGGGTRPQISPRPWVDLMEGGDRPLHGARLYLAGKAPLLILSGGRVSWYGSGGAPESADMAEIVQAMGVPAQAIEQDPTSLNTYENAINVQQILRRRGVNRILLVTSATHMPRSLKIFQKLGIEVIPAPTDFQITQAAAKAEPPTIEARLLGLIPSSDKLEGSTRAIKEYIGLVIYRLRGWL